MMYASKKAAKEVIEHYKDLTEIFNGELSMDYMKHLVSCCELDEAETNVIIAALVLAGAKFTIE